MLSSHFPSSYGQQLLVAGADGDDADRRLDPALLQPAAPGADGLGDPGDRGVGDCRGRRLRSRPGGAGGRSVGVGAVSFTRVQSIVQQRCVPCHSAHPTRVSVAPKGVVFGTPSPDLRAGLAHRAGRGHDEGHADRQRNRDDPGGAGTCSARGSVRARRSSRFPRDDLGTRGGSCCNPDGAQDVPRQQSRRRLLVGVAGERLSARDRRGEFRFTARLEEAAPTTVAAFRRLLPWRAGSSTRGGRGGLLDPVRRARCRLSAREARRRYPGARQLLFFPAA